MSSLPLLLAQVQLGSHSHSSSPYQETPYLAWPHHHSRNDGAFLPLQQRQRKRLQIDSTLPEHAINPVYAWDRHPPALPPLKQHQVGRLSKKDVISQSDVPFPASECQSLASHLSPRWDGWSAHALHLSLYRDRHQQPHHHRTSSTSSYRSHANLVRRRCIRVSSFSLSSCAFISLRRPPRQECSAHHLALWLLPFANPTDGQDGGKPQC